MESDFFNRAVAAMHFFRVYMEQVIFDRSYLLRIALFLRRSIIGIQFFKGQSAYFTTIMQPYIP